MLKALLPRGVVVRSLPRRARNAVLLTFDDGPDPDVTPAVLDRLRLHGARAVFFVVGRRIKRAPALIARILQEGHVVGNHSHLHQASYVLPGGRQPRFLHYYRDCRRCQTAIQHHGGKRPRLFRPPGGRLTLKTLMIPKLLGMKCVTWSADVGDWSFRSAAEARAGAEELARTVAPTDIVLLHDDNPCVIDLLDALLPALRARGLDLASGVELI